MRRFPLILTVVVVTGLLLASSRVRQDRGWIDSISGSQKRQTVWRFGMASAPVVLESPLAARYRKLGLQWEPDWKNVKGTYFDLFGRNKGSAHGWPAPEIYSFALNPDLQHLYLDASSDGDVQEFFRTMSTGTEEEKKAAVEVAFNTALSAAEMPRRN